MGISTPYPYSLVKNGLSQSASTFNRGECRGRGKRFSHELHKKGCDREDVTRPVKLGV